MIAQMPLGRQFVKKTYGNHCKNLDYYLLSFGIRYLLMDIASRYSYNESCWGFYLVLF